MKFTEGPWHIDDSDGERLIVRGEDNGFIADCGDGHYNDDGLYIRSAYAEPNARLIAAAPDLLQELRNIANADTDEWDDKTEFEVWAKSRARAAIAKATGEPS